MTTLTLSEMTRTDLHHLATDRCARLLFLADFLDKLPVSALRMDVWMSDVSDEALDPDHFAPDRAQQLIGASSLKSLNDGSGMVEFTPDPIIHASCGFAACAVGWAGSCAEFKDLGLHMVIGEDCGELVAYPVYNGEIGMDAVEDFFDITFVESQTLFTPRGYDDEVTPQDVALKIRAFVANELGN